MKKIVLDTKLEGINDTPADMFMFALHQPTNPEQGANYHEAVRVCGVIKIISDAKKDTKNEILLENNEFNILVEKLKAARFPVIAPAIVDFINTVANLPDVKVEEAK